MCKGQEEGQEVSAQHPLAFGFQRGLCHLPRVHIGLENREVVDAEDFGEAIAAFVRSREGCAKAEVVDGNGSTGIQQSAKRINLRQVKVAHAGKVREQVKVVFPAAEGSDPCRLEGDRVEKRIKAVACRLSIRGRLVREEQDGVGWLRVGFAHDVEHARKPCLRECERVVGELAEAARATRQRKTEVRIANVLVVAKVTDAFWPLRNKGRAGVARPIGRAVVRDDDLDLFGLGERRKGD